MMSCSPLKSQPTFRRNLPSPLSQLSLSRYQWEPVTSRVPPKRRIIFKWLCSIISRNIISACEHWTFLVEKTAVTFWRWRHWLIMAYSNSCGRWSILSQVKLYYDRRSVGEPVMVSGTLFGPATNFSSFLELFIDSYWFNNVGRLLWREVGFVVLSWAYFIDSVFETPPTWKVMLLYLFPPGTG
jgi:hypothetical protein